MFIKNYFPLLQFLSDMEFLEVLTEGLERVLMVRGGGREVITIYSWRIFISSSYHPHHYFLHLHILWHHFSHTWKTSACAPHGLFKFATFYNVNCIEIPARCYLFSAVWLLLLNIFDKTLEYLLYTVTFWN
jgi:hypothetical protein